MNSFVWAARLSLFLCVAPVLTIARSSQYPWIYPGDFNERLAHADLVVSGTIDSTVPDRTRMVDGVGTRRLPSRVG
jgi:hypothetical protein